MSNYNILLPLRQSLRALYVSHTGMTEPLGHSQVLPYVEGLARAGYSMEILAFEPERATVDEIVAIENRLRRAGIGYLWSRRSASHAFSVKMAEATWALTRLLPRALVRRPRIVHARSYLPSAVAHLTASLSPHTRFLFDVRGLLGEEYVDAGHWTVESYRYKLLKRVEKRLFAHADGVVVLTERHRRHLYEEARLVARETPIEVIPTCVDVGRFSANEEARARWRAELGADDRFVLIYSGTLGGWYLEEEMVRFYSALRRQRRAIFALYTHSPTNRIEAAIARVGVPRDEFVVRRVAPGDMPAALTAADAAVSFIAPCFSKLGSSPTKTAEYLAIGLPTVLNRGVGDSDRLIDEVPAVIDAGGLAQEELERAAEELMALDVRALSESARRAAVERFSIETVGLPRYIRLYQKLVA
jgi:glycosyltransferase involved in cell wall biosynthesis